MTSDSQPSNAEIYALLLEIKGMLERYPIPAPPPIDFTEHLQVIMGAVGGSHFTTRELVERAQSPNASTLRSALGSLAGEIDAQKIGIALKKIQGRSFGGLLVEFVKMERGGNLWQVRDSA